MAVYTDVSFEDLQDFLAAYDIGPTHVFKGIAEGVSNSNYYLQTEKGAFILTLYEKRVAVDDLPFYLGLMEHLARAGIACPTPVHARNGKVTGTLNDKPAAILTFLDGVSLRRPTAEHCSFAGRALAELHEAGAGFRGKRANALSLDGWRTLAADCKGKSDTIGDGLGSLIDDELATLATAWPAALPAGVIHADLFPDNVLFVDNKLSGIIDFYFACNDALAYDLAVTLNAWCFETDGAFNLTKGRALAAGYQAKRKLQPAERAAFPILCRGAALRFLLTRLYDWINPDPAALVRPKDPREFARRLRFHRNASGPEAYGL
jgi:homoserine kinase type II